MSDDYLWDKSGDPDPEIARLEEALAPLRHEGAWREPTAEAPLRAAGAAAPREPARAFLLHDAGAAAPGNDTTAPRPGGLGETARRRLRRPAWIAGGALALAAAIALAIGGARSLGPGRGPEVRASAPAPGVSSAPRPDERHVEAACPPSGAGFRFEGSSPVLCGGGLARAGSLLVDTWLETGDGATARLDVADIGAITMYSSSKLRIARTDALEHRLELVRGSLHAKVNAPPRLFVIDTRAATAVDLGCEYDLRVDEQGRSHLRVTSGAVSLEGKGRAVHVPQGARVTADPERGPGVVLGDAAGPPLRAAAGRLDSGEAGALGDVLAAAGPDDSVTLWNLLAGASLGPGAKREEAREVREKVVGRLEQLALRPATVKRGALVAGQREALDALREGLEERWYAVEPARSVTW